MSTRLAALLAEEEALEKRLAVERARRGLLNFTRYTSPEGYEINHHHRTIARYLNLMASGDCPRLMVCLPPRHGKSRLVSIEFPAYLLGVNPDAQILAASYNATLAAKMNRSVQRKIDAAQYREVFPGTTLNGSNVRTTAQGSYLRNSDEFEVVGWKGFYRSSGVGGSATGYGATCFVGGTLIETERGKIPIADFYGDEDPPRVWAFDHTTGRRKLCRVARVSRSRHTEFVSITFAGASPLTCTPEHLVWTRERGYWPAADCNASTQYLRPVFEGELGQKGNLLPSVPDAGGQKSDAVRDVFRLRDHGLRYREVFSVPEKVQAHALGRVSESDTKNQGADVLLHTRVFDAGMEREAAGLYDLSAVRMSSAEDKSLLQRLVQKSRAPRPDQGEARPEVSYVPAALPLSHKREVLLDALQKQGALADDEGAIQSSVCGWPVHHTAILQSRVQEPGSVDPTTRQTPMRALQSDGQGEPGACASYQRGQKRQSFRQPDSVLRKLPFSASPLGYARAEKIESHSGPEEFVYDLEVEECHNYFAGETLCHNCGIVDDAVKNAAEAASQTYRDKVWDWYTSTFYTRLEKHGSLCVIGTRWHADDLQGRLLQQAQANPNADQWVVLNLPALNETGPSDFDPRELGEALWPNKYPLSKLSRIRNVIGERDWVSLYQQRPAPAEGAIVKREWWRFYRDRPEKFDEVCISADLTFEDKAKNDFAVYLVIGRVKASYYVIGMTRARMEFVQQKRTLRMLLQRYPEVSRIYVEKAANGYALISDMRGDVNGLIPVKPLGSKVARLEAITPLIEAGNVYLPDPKEPNSAWAQLVIEETAAFPNGANDDICDALSQGLSEMRKRRGYTGVRATDIPKLGGISANF